MSLTGPSDPRGLTRRTVLRAGGGMVAATAFSPYAEALARATSAPGVRRPDSLPDPTRPAGTVDETIPFDSIVIVMQENHSFDNYLGMLPRRGQPLADGFTFDAHGRPVNANPVKGGHIVIQHALSDCTPDGGGSQSWGDTHRQINGGRMDGFAATGEPSMTYWDESDLPFYYSMAKTFTLANRWFASCPAQTYPNRRFLLAATAFGLLTTDTTQITENPPNGTIVDRLNAHGVSWKDYFTDVPATGVIESIPQDNPANLASLQQFHADCAAGTLPAVCFVDSDIGLAHEVGSRIPDPLVGPTLNNQDQDEEYGVLALGENYVSQVVNSVLKSPQWPRILLIWTYDEHGGWYDHVPVPSAIAPDNIPPDIQPGDPKGGYDIYGVRVPAVVVSGHAKKNAVTNVVHDHTSILAMIEKKWNLPAMTFRDANAATMEDFLSPEVVFPVAPTLAAPGDLLASEQTCTTKPPSYQVIPDPPPSRHALPESARLLLSGYVTADHRRAVALLHTDGGRLGPLVIELRRGARVIARARVREVGPHQHAAVLRSGGTSHFAPGRYTLAAVRGGRVLAVKPLTVR